MKTWILQNVCICDRKGSRRTLPEFLTEEIVRRVGMLRRQLWRTYFWFYLIYYDYFTIKVKTNWQGLLLLLKMEFQQLHSILKQKNEQDICSSGFRILDLMQSLISVLRERKPMRFRATAEDGKRRLAGSLSWEDGAESPGRLCGYSLQDKMLEKRKLQRDQL